MKMSLLALAVSVASIFALSASAAELCGSVVVKPYDGMYIQVSTGPMTPAFKKYYLATTYPNRREAEHVVKKRERLIAKIKGGFMCIKGGTYQGPDYESYIVVDSVRSAVKLPQ